MSSFEVIILIAIVAYVVVKFVRDGKATGNFNPFDPTPKNPRNLK